MADVAQKLEQLDMAMGSSSAQDDALLSQLATDTVHYNPSDLSNWLENMLSELNAPPIPLLPAPPPHPIPISSDFLAGNMSAPFHEPGDPDYYLPRRALCGPEPQVDCGSRNRKRMKASSPSTFSSRTPAPAAGSTTPATTVGGEVSSVHPLVMLDTQEAGIRLVHALLACAEAVHEENYKAADAILKQISVLASSQGGAMRKVAGYFAEALARRIYRINPHQDASLDSAFSDILEMHFYESCPYLKFAHFTANQAILEAFSGCRRVHVIDFGIKQGMQWPALLQALALRPGGPPSFRLTGIGPPQPDNSDALQQVGWKLAQLASTIHVEFEYRGFVANSLADLEVFMLESPLSSSGGSAEPQVVAINSVFELHSLLARPGALEKLLSTVRSVRPRILTVVEQEANHNASGLLERFTEALHYYSSMFDSLEGGGGGAGDGEWQQDQIMSEVFLGRQICNVVACEGAERTERHETLDQWRARMARAGFQPVHLGSNAFKQASMLLALFAGGDGYRVEEKEGHLTLGWHTRPLIATSAWRVSGASVSGQSSGGAAH